MGNEVILGILSDTHGLVTRTVAAVRTLEHLGAQAFVHCGDIGGMEILDALSGRQAWVVFGNTDYPDAALVNYGRTLGLTIAAHGPLRFEWAGKAFAAFHGHEREFTRLIESIENAGELPSAFGRCDYVLHGHTHMVTDRYVGPLRVINPGAVQRAVVHTVATLDTREDAVQFWQISEDPRRPDPVQYLPEGHWPRW
jgi:uncharacterized protein